MFLPSNKEANMLYRPTPRRSALTRLSGALTAIAGFLASLRREGGDKRYLDQLNDREPALP